MLYYDRTDLSEEIYLTKSNNSTDLNDFNHGFKVQDSICNGCHNLTILSLNLTDIAIITVKGLNYSCIIREISRSDAINLLKSSVFEDLGYI